MRSCRFRGEDTDESPSLAVAAHVILRAAGAPPARRRRSSAPGRAGALPVTDDITCDAITATFRLFQRRRGHRFSLDDLATAWEAARARPEASSVVDSRLRRGLRAAHGGLSPAGGAPLRRRGAGGLVRPGPPQRRGERPRGARDAHPRRPAGGFARLASWDRRAGDGYAALPSPGHGAGLARSAARGGADSSSAEASRTTSRPPRGWSPRGAPSWCAPTGAPRSACSEARRRPGSRRGGASTSWRAPGPRGRSSPYGRAPRSLPPPLPGGSRDPARSSTRRSSCVTRRASGRRRRSRCGASSGSTDGRHLARAKPFQLP